MEKLDISGITDYPCPPRNNGQPCHGCGNIRKGKCDNAALNKVSPYFFMFDTMTGHSSLHHRYDEKPNKMQKLIGDTAGNDSCGTRHTADFLFGFTGYKYSKCIDKTLFREKIISSINAGKPVLAEGKPGEKRGGRFHVITGYDGEKLISPVNDYFYGRVRPDGAPEFDELVTLYIFGDKTTPKYKLINGLENMQHVIEYNINEKIWDGYLEKMGDRDTFPSSPDKADMDEIKKRMMLMLNIIRYKMNTHLIQKAFQDIHIRHREMLDPVFSELWKKIHSTAVYIGHGPENKIAKINWETIKLSTLNSISKEICNEIIKVRESEIKLLGHINEGIKILNERSE